jgi:predicted nucleotidyltransferase/predicted HicB family RNase H-like nuclease
LSDLGLEFLGVQHSAQYLEYLISISIPEGKNKAGDLEKKSSKITAEFRTGSDLTGTDWLLCCQILLSNSYHDIISGMKFARATLVLRIPSLLHQQLKQDARSADLSLNKHCRNLLSGRTGDFSSEGASTSLKLAAGGSRHMALLRELSAQALEAMGDSVEGLVLFGSFARGRQTASSDIDLLVVLNGNMTLDRDVYSRWQLCKFDGREVAPLFVQIPHEGERIGGLWFEVALDGIVLYDKDLHLSRFLSDVRDLVASGQVKRMVTHGHPYWVHSSRKSPDLSSEGGP